ncbi:hypothetical protein Nepgr_008993 [Nepenthes gracilis]|uniref:Uncharacterized protein n=1 Tax=Nepenthes gracilis TaxID=150966 RepID=A0AAD3XJS1_NEPGR|nr:hypothetical protein Nepgr_008993 [Nepenthes gracilis]
MASPVSNLARPTVGGGGGGGDEVYVAATPLRAGKGPAQLLMSAAFSFNIWDLQHFMLILRRSPLSQAFVFDFQPQDPENIYVALTALSGGTVPGITLVRKIKRLPRRKCWFIGTSKVNAMEAAYKFNTGWHTDLRVGYHDCRDYINGLVEVLTGENEVLEHLRRRART